MTHEIFFKFVKISTCRQGGTFVIRLPSSIRLNPGPIRNLLSGGPLRPPTSQFSFYLIFILFKTGSVFVSREVSMVLEFETKRKWRDGTPGRTTPGRLDTQFPP